ncbi:MAG: division/cell wall cluster transcriptional repressor MraZ [Planctomycetales bacterium]|nr:division/cell wall cluster transcriptional repressor MraZ [Planctomycetales bacterium]
MPLTGTFTRAVDDKQRIAIPKELRAALGENREGIFYVAPGTDGSLAIYEQDAFVQMGQRLAHAPPAQRDVRAFGRLFYAQAHRVELDRQGRLRIPTPLSDWAGLGREVVLVGVGDHMELWEQRRWESYTSEQQGKYDELAEAAFGYPPA